MKDGIVKDACTKLGMDPVCFSSGSNLNVDGCVETAKGGQSMRAISESLCGHNNPANCSTMLGLFVSMKNWTGGAELGVLEGRYGVNGKTYTSGPGWVYTPTTKIAQYYGICAIKRWEEDIEEKIFNVQGKINNFAIF